MISRNSLEGVYPLAKILVKRGIGLEAIEGSAVGALNETTTVITKDGSNDEGAAVELDSKATAEITSVTSGPLPTSHNLEFDSIVENGIKMVLRQLNIARNEVIPICDRMVAAVSEIMQENTNEQIQKYSVKIDTLPQVFRNGNLLAILEEYKASQIRPQTTVFNFGEMVAEDVIAKLNTGFKATDDDIALWVGEQGTDFFIRVWNDFFNITPSSEVGDYFEKLSSDRNRSLAVFLIARTLMDNPIETANMNLTEYTNNLSIIRNLAGYVLYHQLVTLDNNINRGMLIIGCQRGVATVNGDVYDKWLREGGDVDVILGYALINDQAGNPGVATEFELSENKDKLLKAWYNFVSIAKASALENKYRTLRGTLTSTFLRYLEDEVGNQEGFDGDIARMYKDFKEALFKTPDEELRDINRAVTKLVCCSRFKNTDAFILLSRIDFYTKENPELEVREAATLAVIDYVTDWVFKQIRIVGKPLK